MEGFYAISNLLQATNPGRIEQKYSNRFRRLGQFLLTQPLLAEALKKAD